MCNEIIDLIPKTFQKRNFYIPILIFIKVALKQNKKINKANQVFFFFCTANFENECIAMYHKLH